MYRLTCSHHVIHQGTRRQKGDSELAKQLQLEPPETTGCPPLSHALPKLKTDTSNTHVPKGVSILMCSISPPVVVVVLVVVVVVAGVVVVVVVVVDLSLPIVILPYFAYFVHPP